MQTNKVSIKLSIPDQDNLIDIKPDDVLKVVFENIKSGQRLNFTGSLDNNNLELQVRNETIFEKISRKAHAFFTNIGLGIKAADAHVSNQIKSASNNHSEIDGLLTLIKERNSQSVWLLKKPHFKFGIGRDSIRKYQRNLEIKINRTPPAVIPEGRENIILTQFKNYKKDEVSGSLSQDANTFAAGIKRKSDTTTEVNRYALAFFDFVMAQAEGKLPELESDDVYEFAERWNQTRYPGKVDDYEIQIPLDSLSDEKMNDAEIEEHRNDINVIVDNLLNHKRQQQNDLRSQLLMKSLEESGFLG